MRIGVYVDAFNLYYGARNLCGRGEPGWRWIDLRALAHRLVTNCSAWISESNEEPSLRIVYCTAMVSGASNPSGAADQEIYVRALKAAKSVDHVELGNYVARVANAPLATRDKKDRPQLVKPQWPLMVQDEDCNHIDAKFIVSVARREEKGSDVNVASHLLIDTLNGDIDAAIVISNDSDLRFPVRFARDHVPVGMVNPSSNYLAGKLRGSPADGVGNHWWYQLSDTDVRACQLPARIGKLTKPIGW